MSLVADANPVWSAPPYPRFTGWCTTRTQGYRRGHPPGLGARVVGGPAAPAADRSGQVQHFDQKRVALRAEVGQWQAAQRLAPPAAEPAGAVTHREARHRPYIMIGERAQHNPPERAVDDAGAGAGPGP